MATMTTEGRRIYIQTTYGEACVAPLKELGAHWEASSKRWWIGSGKRAEVERIIASHFAPAPPSGSAPSGSGAGSGAGNGQEREPEDPDKVMVRGKARYKGRSYYVRWEGTTKKGDRKFRLTVLDGKIDFWADAALVEWEKRYEEERTLGSLARFIERKKRESGEGGGRSSGEGEGSLAGTRGGEDWYYNSDGEPGPMRGCGQCRAEGGMCKSCQFDEFDN